MNSATDAPAVGVLLADPRLERLLTIAKEINDLLVKINVATSYLSGNEDVEDFDEVEVARTQLSRDLAREFSEARELLPCIDEIIAKLEDQGRDLENSRKMSVGLARIEGLSGTEKQKQFLDAAEAAKAKVSEIDNLVGALGALHHDLSSNRRTPHACPRCSSTKVSYRLTPSELGFTIYRCEGCSNAWRITEFSIRI